MYKVVKKDGKVFILDTFTDKPIYSSPEDGYIVYKTEGGARAAQVGKMTDEQLLTALANAIKLLS